MGTRIHATLAIVRLTALLALAGYTFACFHDVAADQVAVQEPGSAAMAQAMPGKPWLAPIRAWPAKWQMFTFIDYEQVFVNFEGWDGAAWVRLPMERWFPARWESGYRWDKGGTNNPAARAAWLDAACRHANEEAGAGASPAALVVEKVRVNEVRWKKTPGRSWQAQRSPRTRTVGERQCRR